MDFLIGSAGFVLYFLYDINSIQWKKNVINRFFLIGSILVLAGTVYCVVRNWVSGWSGLRTLFAVGCCVFFILLIYTLFFALPFEETYVEESKERMAYTEGVYALCRHPGVLWFIGLYLCLWGLTGDVASWGFFLTLIFWNVAYIIFQDLWSFPGTFPNYPEYRKTTPFLFPVPGSIRRAYRTARFRK